MAKRYGIFFVVVMLIGIVGGASLIAEAPAEVRYLIIHADDAGMCHSVNTGTIESMERGFVTSASIMVPCPWFKEIAAYAKDHPEQDFGLHLTLNSEWKNYRWGPVASKDRVPSLIDEEGYLWSSTEQVARHAKLDEVEIEIRAQIERALQFGVPVTHLDTHMGSLGSRPELLELYVKLGIEYDLPVLLPRDTAQIARLGPDHLAKHQALLDRLDAAKLPIVDYIPRLDPGLPYNVRRDGYIKAIRKLKPGVTEIIIHCAHDSAELRHITPRPHNRDGDRKAFSDPLIRLEIEKLGIKLLSWGQFVKLRRGG